jgi:hypothetical protein
MKTFALLVALIMGMVINANGAEIHTTVHEVDRNTVVSCTPIDSKGNIDKARIFLYVSDGINFETGIQPMDVSYENIASFELPGTYELIEGKCKFIMLDEDKKVSRQEFIVSMR